MRLPQLPVPERDLDGLPIVSVLERRLSWGLLLIASVWFTLAASWELFGPQLAGHYAASASLGIAADNMLAWDIIGPVWSYSAHKPPPSQYYCHHPWGIFWTTTALMKIFGRHDFVCRLPAVLLSGDTPPLLFLLGRAIWRPAAGAACAAAFVVLPITLAFANFNALEVPVIAWSTLGLWAYVRHNQTWKRRYLMASLCGFGMALHADWPAYVLVSALLSFGLLHGIVLRRALGRVKLRPYARWWALTAALTAATLGLYLYLFHRSNGLADLFASYNKRSAGSNLSLSEVLASRRYWIELSFTPIAILAGKIAAGLSAVRLLWRRDPHEVVPLLVLCMAAVQYVGFKQGADVHIYWPHYFAAFFALGMGAITATGMGVVEAVQARRRAPSSSPVPALAIVLPLVVVTLLAILRDGAAALPYARATGGRFNEKGLPIHSDGAKTAFLRWLEPQLPPRARVAMHVGMKTTWAQVWALGGRVVQASRPLPGPGTGADVYLADMRFLYDHWQAQLMTSHHVVAVGPFLRVKRGEPQAPVDAHAIAEREPSWLELTFSSGTEPHRQIVADPYLTWELRTLFDQPAQVPTDPPRGFEQLRIAHNIAVERGDEPGAKALLAQLEAHLEEPRVGFQEGIELLGSRYDPGARPLLTLLFRAAGPTDHDIHPAVRSRVLEPASWSTTMADPKVRAVGLPCAIGPIRWRAGHLYSYPVTIVKRPGLEVFELYFQLRRAKPRKGSAQKPRPPRTTDGRQFVEVLRLD